MTFFDLIHSTVFLYAVAATIVLVGVCCCQWGLWRKVEALRAERDAGRVRERELDEAFQHADAKVQVLEQRIANYEWAGEQEWSGR